MPTINCHIPLKLRLTGDLTEDQWEELERTLTHQYTAAFRRSIGEFERTGQWAPESDIRELYDAARDVPPSYLVPAYDSGGQPTPVPVTSGAIVANAGASVDAIIEMIRRRFPASDGLPSNGVKYGYYILMQGETVPNIYYLDIDKGKVVLKSTYFADSAQHFHIRLNLPGGMYSYVVRPYGRGRLYRGGEAVKGFGNPENLDNAIDFYVPPSVGTPPPDTPQKTFYPRVQVLRVSDDDRLTTGAETTYLASVEIWRRETTGESSRVYPLAWIYANVEISWAIYKYNKPTTPTGATTTTLVKSVGMDTHNAYLNFVWQDAGDYAVVCQARIVNYKDASSDPVQDSRHDTVQDLRIKQGLEIAALEKLARTPGAETPWAPNAADLIQRYKDQLSAEQAKASPNKAVVDALTDALQKVEGLLTKHASFGPYPIHAIFTERKTGKTMPLQLFIGPAAGDHKETAAWVLIDVTFPTFYRTYRGAGDNNRAAILQAFEAMRTRFTTTYPRGQILVRLQWPEMSSFGLTPTDLGDYSIETESWERTAYEWLSIGGQALVAAGLAVAFVFPPTSLVVGVIVITGAVVGATVSAINLEERIRGDAFVWDSSAAVDIINIAASLTIVGGAVVRGVARGVTGALAAGEEITVNAARLQTVLKFQRGILFMGLTADISNGVLISYDTYVQLKDVDAAAGPGLLADYKRIYGDDEGLKRFEAERMTRIIGILTRAAVNGLMTLVSISGNRRALGETEATLRASTPQGGLTPTPVPAAITGATTADAYLQALRQEPHTPGSVGRRWDYQRFPEGPPRRWAPGDPVDMPSSSGEYPLYDTARTRFWRNRAHFELEGRRTGQTTQNANSQDPVRRLSDTELQSMQKEGNSPPDPTHPGRVVELEHSGVPQRVRNWLVALGFTTEQASRITQVSNPRDLLEVTPLEHAFFDSEAWGFGSRRADTAGRRWTDTTAADVRGTRPLVSLSDADISTIMTQARARGMNFNQNNATVTLRDALRFEIGVRGLPIAPP